MVLFAFNSITNNGNVDLRTNLFILKTAASLAAIR